MAINRHNLIIKGLKKASSATWNAGYNSGWYFDIMYDRSTGQVWTDTHYSIGQNSWNEYHDSDIIRVLRCSTHITMQEIADEIYHWIQYGMPTPEIV